MDQESLQHYFSKTPSSQSKKKSFAYDFLGNRYIFNTDKGVFSGDYIDKGTQILLAEAVPWLKDKLIDDTEINIVDLGSGYGPIGIILGSEFSNNTKFFGIEINERARILSKENSKKNRIDFLTFESIEEFLQHNDKVDYIISNPPVKIGKKLLHELMKTWLEKVEKGALLVMQKHLGADSFINWCNEQGFNAKKIASKKGFRIIEIVK